MRAYRRSLVALLKSKNIDKESFRGVEVGVMEGETSRYLLSQFPNMSLLLVDPWLAPQPGTAWYNSQRHKVDQVTMDRRMLLTRQNTDFASDRRIIIRATSVEAAKKILDGVLMMVFIDGDHTEIAVAQDLRAWWPKLRSGGLFCGHDYYHNRRGEGVGLAVDRWAREEGREIKVAAGGVWHTWKE